MVKKVFIILILLSTIIVSSQNKVTICWDTSLSMLDRNIQYEFDFLENYFSKNADSDVTLLMFSNSPISNEKYLVKAGNWNAIKSKLTDVIYNGSTSYGGLKDQINGGDILLFTDGIQNNNITNPKFNGVLYLINSNHNYNKENIILLSIINNGEFINIDKTDALSNNKKNYSGIIYSDNILVPNVKITLKKDGKTITSNKDGTYRIDAIPGDVLVFSSPGRRSVEKVLGENLRIDVWLDKKGIRLEEVVVTTGKKAVEDNKIITASGRQNKERIGYGIESIQEDNILDITTDVSQAMQGKFTGVEYGFNDDISQAIIRGANSILLNNYALIVVDGSVISQSNSGVGIGLPIQKTTFLDPNNIADITVLKGLAATNSYGSLGKNGVILITTKGAVFDDVNTVSKDLALLTNNIYTGKIKVNNKLLTTPYLKELKKGKNISEAFTIYLNQRAKYRNNSEYFIDVFDFFNGSNQVLAYQILSNVLEIEQPSIESLKAMMFKAHKHGNYRLSLDAANKALELYPQRIESYLDVALANKYTGNLQLALNMLNGISKGSINVSLNFFGLQKIIVNELKSIIYEYRARLDISKIDSKYLKNTRYDVRIVFDWSNNDSEFELQFVNPQKRFFKWKHSDLENSERIRDEIINGYSKEEFKLIGAEKGVWIINVKYLGNRSKENTTPTFLKCTVQYDFGQPNQKTVEYVLRLYEKGKENLVAKLNIN